MNRCQRCGGKLADGRRKTHADCPDPRKPGGRRQVVAFSLSPDQVARLDELRGELGRSEWLQNLLVALSSRRGHGEN